MRRLLAAATLLALLAVPATAGAGLPTPASNCDNAPPGRTCVYWCPVNPGGGGGYMPCELRNEPSISVDGPTTIVRANVDPLLAVASSTIDQATARTISQSAQGQLLPSEDLSKLNISLECTALATPNPLATGVQRCFLLGQDGARYDAIDDGAMPGAADASVHAVLKVPTQGYRVCVQSHAFFQDNVHVQAQQVCSS